MDLLNKTDIVASAPREIDAAVVPFITSTNADLPQTPSLITLLQKQLLGQAEQNWLLDILPRPFKPRQEEDLIDVTDESTGLAGRKHPFPNIVVPQTIYSGANPCFPETYFSLYSNQDVETVPTTEHIGSSLIRDALVDTIIVLDFNRSITAKFLIELDCYWAPGIFARRAVAFDKLKDGNEGSTWKPEDLAVDAIFSQMMQLPVPDHKTVYYHALVTETCKVAPAAIAPSLGRAIRFLYGKLDIMDSELWYRFIDWFSHHLSNFDYRWKWTEW